MSLLIFQNCLGCIWERLARLGRPSLKTAQQTAPDGTHLPVECRYRSKFSNLCYLFTNAKLTFNCFFYSLGLQLYLARVHGDHSGAVLLQVPASLRASGTSCCKFPQASELQVHLVASFCQPQSFRYLLLQSSCQPQSYRYILLQVSASLRALGTSCCKVPASLRA
jgi:hypothetical protein